MKTIYKYTLSLEEITVIELPEGAVILTIQLQMNKPVMWAEVDTNAPKVRRSFRTVATGENLDDPLQVARTYVGTYQLEEGSLVLHVFEIMIRAVVPSQHFKK